MRKEMITLTLATLLLMTGCSSASDAPKKDPQNIGSEKDEGTPENQEVKYVFGEIGEIVGNEIVLNYIKPPKDEVLPPVTPMDPDDEKDGSSGDGSISMSMTITASSIAGAAGDIKVDRADPIVDVEFTGENGEYLIPSNTKLMDMTGGGKTKLEDLAKGTIVCLVITKDAEGESITRVDILS